MDLGLILSVIWPYLAALYLLDCVLVVRGGRLLFTGTTSAGFAIRKPGLRLAGLLPWSWSILTSTDPVILSKSGIYARIHPDAPLTRPCRREDYEFIPWDAAREIRTDGKRVLIGRGERITLSTEIEAEEYRDRILALRDLPAERRAETLADVLDAASNTDNVRAAMERAWDITSSLNVVNTGLFLWFLVAVPFSLLMRLPSAALWTVFAVFVFGWLVVMVLWWQAHCALFPRARMDRLVETLVFVLFPASALHALGKLTRRLLAPFDSTAITTALVPNMAGETLRKEWIRSTSSASSGGPDDFTWAWEMRGRALERLAGKAGSVLSVEGKRPESAGEGEAACPLCGASYRGGITMCADCGVALGNHTLVS